MEKLKAILKSLGQRLNNTGSVLAFIGLIINILMQFGFNLDVHWINNTATAICALLVFLGILNSPTENTKAYVPGLSDKLIDKE